MSCDYKDSKSKLDMVVVYTKNHTRFQYGYPTRPSEMTTFALEKLSEGYHVWCEWGLKGSDYYRKVSFCKDCNTFHHSRGESLKRKKL